jgi:hypothetical protein
LANPEELAMLNKMVSKLQQEKDTNAIRIASTPS